MACETAGERARGQARMAEATGPHLSRSVSGTCFKDIVCTHPICQRERSPLLMVTAVRALLVHAQSPRALPCLIWRECAVTTLLTREVILYKKVPMDRLDSSCMSQSWLSRRLGMESPKRKTAGSSCGRFLSRVTWNGRTHHKYGWHLLLAAQIKGGSRKKLRFSPACLQISCQAHLPVAVAAAVAVAILQGHQNLASSAFQHGQKTCDSPGISRHSAPEQDCWGTWPSTLRSYQVLSLSPMKTAILGLPRPRLRLYCVNQSNKSPLNLYLLLLQRILNKSTQAIHKLLWPLIFNCHLFEPSWKGKIQSKSDFLIEKFFTFQWASQSTARSLFLLSA